MKTIATLVLAGALATVTTVATATDAEAKHRRGHHARHYNPAPAIIGGVIGGILLNQAFRDRYSYDPYYYNYSPYGYGYRQNYDYGRPHWREHRYRHNGWPGHRGGPYGGYHAPEGSVTR